MYKSESIISAPKKNYKNLDEFLQDFRNSITIDFQYELEVLKSIGVILEVESEISETDTEYVAKYVATWKDKKSYEKAFKNKSFSKAVKEVRDVQDKKFKVVRRKD